MQLNIIKFDNIVSTNTHLKELARQGASEGTVVLAKHQSGGRGRLGRSFFSDDGVGIYLSILLRPAIAPKDAYKLTCMSAVAVCNALQPYSIKPVGIKWVNDIQIEGKKVCGILTESSTRDGNGIDWAVVGIGINLCAPRQGYPKDIASIAAALFDDEAAALNEYESIISKIIEELFKLYTSFKDDGFVFDYISKSVLINQTVTLRQNGTESICKVLSVDEQCRLVVEYEDGTVDKIFSGEAVSLSKL